MSVRLFTLYFSGAKDTFKPTRLLRFNPLFDGLRLGVLEDVDVKLGRDRLGFFQVPPVT